MKIQLKKILMNCKLSKITMMTTVVLCLTNISFAQMFSMDEMSDDTDDFFEFVVVEQPEVESDENLTAVETLNETDIEQDITANVESADTAGDESTDVTSGGEENSVQIEKNQEYQTQEEQKKVPEQSGVVETIMPAEIKDDSSANSPEITDSKNETSPSVVGVSTENASTPASEKENPSSSTNTNIANNTPDVPETSEEMETDSEEPVVDEKAPSRTVSMKKKQYLDVTYPGEGWLYMGDENNSKTLSFKGREQKGNSTLLKFYSDRAGEALLHFCKQDILTDTYIHDYLLVTIDKTNGNKQHIKAPEYIPPVVQIDDKENEEADIIENELSNEIDKEPEEVPEEISEDQEEQSETVIEDIIIDSGISLADEPDVIFSFGDGIDFGDGYDDDDYYQQLIDEANDAFFAGRGQEAVDKAQLIIDDGSYFSDEAYYIQAQVYETNSDMLDVNKAYDLYKTIVDYYPESSYWNKASKRVTYFERYYFQIR
ncbi:MAG: hypothetical protein K5751_00785 [Treponemataceae bacterium]|nr:hypothetical protein [Treponemataceae bacterium]